MWAIPGGFKRPTETLDEAAKRELREETGVDAASVLAQFGAYGDPGRDPRMNVVTVAYLAVLRDVGDVAGGHRRRSTPASLPVSDVLNGKIQLAFDHQRIVRDAIERVRVELEVSGIATAFVGNDVHDGRAPHRLRGDLGRAARRRELPAQHPRRGRLGHSDRPPSAARFRRRQAGRALPRRTGLGPRRPDPRAPAATRGSEPCEPLSTIATGRRRSCGRRRRASSAEGRRGSRPGPRDDRYPDATAGFAAPSLSSAAAFTGLCRPKRRILGIEFAGVVEAVGAAVTRVPVGDEVFGIKGWRERGVRLRPRERSRWRTSPKA